MAVIGGSTVSHNIGSLLEIPENSVPLILPLEILGNLKPVAKCPKIGKCNII